MLSIFITFSSLKGFIKKNGKLFDRYASLPSKFVKGIEQNPRVVFETKRPEMNLEKGDENQLNSRLNARLIEHLLLNAAV